jgi:hypothetical protein
MTKGENGQWYGGICLHEIRRVERNESPIMGRFRTVNHPRVESDQDSRRDWFWKEKEKKIGNPSVSEACKSQRVDV